MREVIMAGLRIAMILWGIIFVFNTANAQNSTGGEGQSFPPEKPVTECQISKHFFAPYDYIGSISTGTYFVSYFDPGDYCDTPLYPLEITAFGLSMDDFYIGVWPVQIDVVIFDLHDPDDPCQGPGEELFRFTASCDEETFLFPAYGTIPFPEVYCVNSPFIIGIEYTDTGDGPFPSPIFDEYGSECENWYKNPSYNWVDFSISGFGDPFYRVYADTYSPNCPPANIPTLSEWGMIIMALLILTIGTAAVVRRKKVNLCKSA